MTPFPVSISRVDLVAGWGGELINTAQYSTDLTGFSAIIPPLVDADTHCNSLISSNLVTQQLKTNQTPHLTLLTFCSANLCISMSGRGEATSFILVSQLHSRLGCLYLVFAQMNKPYLSKIKLILNSRSSIHGVRRTR